MPTGRSRRDRPCAEGGPVVRDPITETAHYVAVVRRGCTELFLIQGGQIEEQGLAQVIWDRRDRVRQGPEAARPPHREAAAS